MQGWIQEAELFVRDVVEDVIPETHRLTRVFFAFGNPMKELCTGDLPMLVIEYLSLHPRYPLSFPYEITQRIREKYTSEQFMVYLCEEAEVV